MNIDIKQQLFYSAWLVLALAFNSCSSSDCSNGEMDGDETGIDCGGSCPACPEYTATEEALFGIWYMDYMIYYPVSDSATEGFNYAEDNDCMMDLTFEIYDASPDQFISKGILTGCVYNAENTWWVSDEGMVLNDTYIIETLTTDSLVFRTFDDSWLYGYYR